MCPRFLIYGLTDPRTGTVRYIGRSSSGLVRPKHHSVPAVLAKDKTYKANWIRSLLRGGVRPGIVVLEGVPGVDDLNDAECFWIAQARGLGWPLTNLTKGGDGLSGPSPETRARMRAAMVGRTFTEEHRARISAALRGRKVSEEARRNQSLAGKRRPPPSAETRKKIGAAHKGKVLTGRALENARFGSIGRKRSAETRARNSAVMSARVYDAVAREKRRLAALAQWARVKASGGPKKFGFPTQGDSNAQN